LPRPWWLVVLALAGLAAQAWRRRRPVLRGRGVLRHTVAGELEVHPEFRSAALGSRRVWVWLPPQYRREPQRRFPVLYVQDGQNVFDGATAFVPGQEWRLDEAAARLVDEGRAEPLLIVAVDNAGERRIAEYTPTRTAEGLGGEAAAYGRMLVEELKPWIDRRYRTRPGREATGIAGSSLGALVSLHLALSRPEVFSRVGALSIAAWWDERFLVSFVDGLPLKPRTRIWLDIGTGEGAAAVRDARLVKDALLRQGWREGEDLFYLEVEGAAHDEAAWARRAPDVLAFLFPAQGDAAGGAPRPRP